MLAIIQARMSSKRLTGKVLKDLCGKPLLSWTICRIKKTEFIGKILIATSTEISDDPIEEFCFSENIPCHRGSLDNVSSRFKEAVLEENVDAFVRISGDSPLIDPMVIDRAVQLYNQSPCDLVTNIMVRTFPKGQSVEVLNTDTFVKVSENIKEVSAKEHVTPSLQKSRKFWYCKLSLADKIQVPKIYPLMNLKIF